MNTAIDLYYHVSLINSESNHIHTFCCFVSIEQDDSKVQPPPGPPQAAIESDDGSTDSRIHPASLSADDDDEETMIELNLENELLERMEKKNERQIFSEKG